MTATCPNGHALDGGPVQFWCGTCHSTVYAADVDNEFRGAA